MSHVDFKKWQRRMSLSLIFPMSHVKFKKRLYHMSLSFFLASALSILGSGAIIISNSREVGYIDLMTTSPFHSLTMPLVQYILSSAKKGA